MKGANQQPEPRKSSDFYRYDLDGISQLPINVQLVGDAVSGPTLNTLTLSDGTTISVLQIIRTEESNDQPAVTSLVTMDNHRVSNFRWRAYRLGAAP